MPIYTKAKDVFIQRRTIDEKFEEYALIVAPNHVIMCDGANDLIAASSSSILTSTSSYSAVSAYAQTASFNLSSSHALVADVASLSLYGITASYALTTGDSGSVGIYDQFWIGGGNDFYITNPADIGVFVDVIFNFETANPTLYRPAEVTLPIPGVYLVSYAVRIVSPTTTVVANCSTKLYNKSKSGEISGSIRTANYFLSGQYQELSVNCIVVATQNNEVIALQASFPDTFGNPDFLSIIRESTLVNFIKTGNLFEGDDTPAIESGSHYNITSSWSTYSLTASYALNAESGGTTLESGSYYYITSSWASSSISSSIADTASYSVSSSVAFTSSFSTNASFSTTSSFSSISDSASYSPLEPYASASLVSQLLAKQDDLITGNTYTITSSWSNDSISSSYAPIEPFVSESIVSQLLAKQDDLITGNTYTITSSVALDAISSSYSPIEPFASSSLVSQLLAKQDDLVVGNTYTITSSWSNNSISASYSPIDTFASESLVSQLALKQDTLIAGGLYSITSSATLDAVSSSYAPIEPFASASLASQLSAKQDTIITGGNYEITASNSISSSYAPIEPFVSASLASQLSAKQDTIISGNTYTITASSAEYSTSASYAPLEPYASASLVSQLLAKQDDLVVGNTYTITSSWSEKSITSSYAPLEPYTSASLVSQLLAKQDDLVVGNTYTITSSWSNNSISSSYAPLEPFASASLASQLLAKQDDLIVGNTYTITASWANNSISSSYSPIEPFASASLSDQLASKQALLVDGNTYQITASASTNSTNAVTASYAVSGSYFSYISYNVTESFTFVVSASFASSSMTASYFNQLWISTGSTYPITSSKSISASYAPFEPFSSASVVAQLAAKQPTLVTGNTYTITSSVAISASYAPYVNTWLTTGSLYPITSSNSISSSFAPINPFASASLVNQLAAKQPTLVTGNTYTITSSVAISASYAPYIDTNTWLTTGSLYPITSSNSVVSISSSFAPLNPFASASLVSQIGNKQNVITTGSTYPITSSVAISASYAPYIDTNTWLTTGSLYPITSSNSIVSISSSFAPLNPFASASLVTQLAGKQATITTGSTYPITASVAISASFAPLNPFASSSLVTQLAGKQATITTGSTYPITASVAISASYAPYTDTNTWLTTGSLYPITSSHALTASYAINSYTASTLIGGTLNYLIKYTGSAGNIPTASDWYIIPDGINGNKMGVNTTNPQAFLHLVGKEALGAIRIQRYTPSANQSIVFAPTDSEITAGSSSYVIGQDNGDFRIAPYPPGINNSVIFLKSGSIDGFRVGIKTENPQSTFHVVGNMTVSSGITGSLLGNASTSTTASYALSVSGATLTTGSTYPITASYALLAINSLSATSSSYSSASLSASFAPLNPFASASLVSQLATKQDTLIVGGTYQITSSWAGHSTTSINSINSTKALYITSSDNRTENRSGSLYEAGLYYDFKSNTTDGLIDGGTYHGVITTRPFGSGTSFSGGPAHQLAFTQNGYIFLRISDFSATNSGSWNSNWKRIVHETSSIVYNITSSFAQKIVGGASGLLVKYTGSCGCEPTGSTQLYVKEIDSTTSHLGFRTSDPTYMIHLSDYRQNGIILQRSIKNSFMGISFRDSDANIAAGSASYQFAQELNGSDFFFNSSTPGTGTPLLYWKSGSSGGYYTGIYTTNPTARLEVNGNVKATSFTGSLSGTATTASVALHSISSDFSVISAFADSASYSATASYAINGGGSGTNLGTGSTYPITASYSIFSIGSLSSDFAINSTYSETASYALNGLGTGSTYPITSSWAINVVNGGSGTNLTSGSTYNITSSYSENEFIIVPVYSNASDNLTIGLTKETIRMPFQGSIRGLRASVNTAPVGSSILIDVNRSGSSILSSVIQIDENEKTSVTSASPSVINSQFFNDDDEFTFDIDQVGSSTPGKGLKLTLYLSRITGSVSTPTYTLVQQSIRNDDTNQFASGITFTYLATSFTASSTFDCRRITVDMAKTGSPTAIVSQKIYSDISGLPNAALYSSTTFISASDVSTLSPITSSYNFDYNSGTNLTSESIYHIAMYVANNTTGSFPSQALLVGIAYNDTPSNNLSRDSDGVSPFTLIYNNTQIGHKLYTLS